MIIGDPNELSRSQENFTNSKGNSTLYNKFKKILDEKSLVDIDFTNLPCIWFNSRTHITVALERLDKVVVNQYNNG